MSLGYKLINSSGDFAEGNLDIAFDAVGRLIELQGLAKLQQDIEKILFTQQNKFYSQYKTLIENYIGTTPIVESLCQTLAQNVIDSLVYLQQLQTEQMKYQSVPAAEVLQAINEVNVTYGGDIATDDVSLVTFYIDVSVSNALQQNLTVSATVGGS